MVSIKEGLIDWVFCPSNEPVRDGVLLIPTSRRRLVGARRLYLHRYPTLFSVVHRFRRRWGAGQFAYFFGVETQI